MAKNAVIYARVSTDEQGRGYSLPTQIDGCKKYAEEHGYILLATFQDAYTGTTLERPGLTELYEFIDTHPVNVLLVYDIDRLSRDVGNQAIIEMEMAQANVEIEYVLGRYAKTPEGELMKLIKSGIAQYENRQRVERSRRGKRGRAQAGYVICPANRAAFGYTYHSEPHRGWLEINEKEAEVVRMIYDWLIVEGLSTYKIARRLWEQQILSRGDYSDVVAKKNGRAEWSPTTVKRIISNPVYKGTWYYGKTRRTKINGKTRQVKVPESEWIEVSVPAIIDAETWELAQKCLVRNKQGAKRNAKRKYLLRSLIFCTCGRRWGGRYKNTHKLAYYRCYSTETQPWFGRCTSRFSYPQIEIENAVWQTVYGFFLEPETLFQEIERRREESEMETEQDRKRLDAVRAALQENERKMEILLDQVLTDGFAQSIIDNRKRELNAERDTLLTKQSQILKKLETVTITPERQQTIIELARQVREGLDNATFETKRHLLEILNVRIDVIDREHFKISGLMSEEGLIVTLSSA